MDSRIPRSEPSDEDQLSSSDMSISVASSFPEIELQGASIVSPTRTPSPAASVFSVCSSDRHNLLRQVYGRTFNAHNEGWMYPADEEEQTRLDAQHAMLKGALNSLYPAQALVRRALAPKQDISPEILDVGTGSGSWAIDMAKEFSHAGVVGIDLVPPMIQGPVPPNVRFEIDDVNLTLTHYTKCFDVVHCRAVCSGIRDFPGLIYNLAQVLRPNGVILLVHGSLQLFDEYFQPLGVVEEGSVGFYPLQNILQSCLGLQASGGCSASIWKQMLKQNPNFTEVDTLHTYIPIGPWQPGLDPDMRHVAELSQYNTLKFAQAVRPMLLESGLDEPLVDRWLELASSDIRRGTSRVYARWEYAWAVRKNSRWKPQHEGQPATK